MELTPIGSKYLLLVVGGYDSNIHCYTCLRSMHKQNNPETYFKYKFSLTGHLNSIKDFAFTSPKFNLPDAVQYLASCS
jgi:hypothetical protein